MDGRGRRRACDPRPRAGASEPRLVSSAPVGDRLRGRVAIVTGSASGLGRAIALRFAEEGATVVVSDVRTDPREGGEPTHELIGAEFVEADVSRWDGVDRLVCGA